MQIIPPSNEFPSKHLTISGLVTVIAGLFTFIVSCVYSHISEFIGTLICCLLMTLIAVLIILTGLYILKPLVEQVTILMVLVLLADIFAFISFCIFCHLANQARMVRIILIFSTYSQDSLVMAIREYIFGLHNRNPDILITRVELTSTTESQLVWSTTSVISSTGEALQIAKPHLPTSSYQRFECPIIHVPKATLLYSGMIYVGQSNYAIRIVRILLIFSTYSQDSLVMAIREYIFGLHNRNPDILITRVELTSTTESQLVWSTTSVISSTGEALQIAKPHLPTSSYQRFECPIIHVPKATLLYSGMIYGAQGNYQAANETILALSIVSVLLLLVVLIFLTFLLYILFRYYQNNGTTTSATHTTHATHTKTVTTTTIETPPART
ncbi:hypothetical protein Ahia01_000792900 [Argonauta hians]